MSDHLQALAADVQSSVVRRILAHLAMPGDPTLKRLPAVVLFADVSGFTPLIATRLGVEPENDPADLGDLLRL